MNAEENLKFAQECYLQGNFHKAFQILSELSGENYPAANLLLGEMFELGRGTLEDLLQAQTYYAKAAQSGMWRGYYRIAQIKLGESNEAQAKIFFNKALPGLEKSAANCEPEGLYILGELLLEDVGIGVDVVRAKGLLATASDLGHLKAKWVLGNFLWDQEFPTSQERAKAIKLFEEAAEGGLEAAQYLLGVLYATDDQIPKNLPRAYYWYSKARESGSVDAMFNMGMMILLGEGVPQNIKKGLDYIHRAGEKNCWEACAYLSKAYKDGLDGLPLDFKKATYWKEKLEKS